MKTFFEFFKFLFSTLKQVVEVAPIGLIAGFIVLAFIGIYFFRKKLKRIPLLLFALLFALLFVQLPNFIAQYQQSFAGALTGIERSIDELNDQQIEEEINNTRQVARLIRLHEKVSHDVLLFQKANAWTIYPVFLTHIRKRVYERTLENYVPAITLNGAGLIAMGWGALFGILVWKLISLPFKNLLKTRNKTQ